jgi:hypothetical protein
VTLSQALAEWRKRAEAATPGPWTFVDGYMMAHENPLVAAPFDSRARIYDRAHIVACTPERIMALLAVVENARLMHSKYRDGPGHCVICAALSALAKSLGCEESSK